MISTDTTPRQQGNYALVNDLKMYYEESGSGQPLLLLHGGGQTSRAWAKHIPLLAKQFRVLAPDSRGHGRSDNPSHTLSYRMMADDVAALIQALGLHKPLICGWSDGANIALEIGIRYPDLAQALICCGLFTRLSEQYRSALRETAFMLAPGVVDYEELERRYPAIVQEAKADHSSVYGPEYWKTLHRDLSVLFLTPLGYTNDDFRIITVPTLILSGDRDEYLPVEEHVDTYRLIPNAELAIVPNANHDFPSDQIEVFIDIVVTFCQRYIAAPDVES